MSVNDFKKHFICAKFTLWIKSAISKLKSLEPRVTLSWNQIIMIFVKSKRFWNKPRTCLCPETKKDRPPITYQLEKGSVRHIFKTSIQYIIGFNAIIGQITKNQSVDFLDLPTAKAIESFQDIALKKNYIFEIDTSIGDSNKIRIDKTTRFWRSMAIWADAEFYFYGKVTSMGGKERSNIHIATDDLGVVIIQTNKEYLERLENNLLYKTYGIRAIGKQHSENRRGGQNKLKVY